MSCIQCVRIFLRCGGSSIILSVRILCVRCAVFWSRLQLTSETPVDIQELMNISTYTVFSGYNRRINVALHLLLAFCV